MATKRRMFNYIGNWRQSGGQGQGPADIAWNAHYRLIYEALVAVGLTPTADTGQVNWTVTSPMVSPLSSVTLGTSYGYNIFAFADNGVGGLPNMFVRVDYIIGNGWTVAGLKFTVATGTNGAGVMNPGSFSFMVGGSDSYSNPNSLTSYVLCDDGADFYLNMAPASGPSFNYWGSPYFVSIARTKSATTGLSDNRGFQIFLKANWNFRGDSDGDNGQRQIVLGPNMEVIYNNWVCTNANSRCTGSGADGITIYPFNEPFDQTRFSGNLFGYFTNDIPKINHQESLTLNGRTRNYLFPGACWVSISYWMNYTSHQLGGNNQSHWGMCHPWEGTMV